MSITVYAIRLLFFIIFMLHNYFPILFFFISEKFTFPTRAIQSMELQTNAAQTQAPPTVTYKLTYLSVKWRSQRIYFMSSALSSSASHPMPSAYWLKPAIQPCPTQPRSCCLTVVSILWFTLRNTHILNKYLDVSLNVDGTRFLNPQDF